MRLGDDPVLIGERINPTGKKRMKEALRSGDMSYLLSEAVRQQDEGAHVLDAFAGSGALGIECLSRGAESAVFFERDKAALEALRSNIDMLKLSQERARVRQADVLATPPVYGAPFDIVILDPPYAYPTEEVWAFVQTLRERGMLAPDAVITYEHHSKVDVAGFIEQTGESVEIHANKIFGKSKVGFVLFSFQEDAEPAE